MCENCCSCVGDCNMLDKYIYIEEALSNGLLKKSVYLGNKLIKVDYYDKKNRIVHHKNSNGFEYSVEYDEDGNIKKYSNSCGVTF